jgi:hypothetical protein
MTKTQQQVEMINPVYCLCVCVGGVAIDRCVGTTDRCVGTIDRCVGTIDRCVCGN